MAPETTVGNSVVVLGKEGLYWCEIMYRLMVSKGAVPGALKCFAETGSV